MFYFGFLQTKVSLPVREYTLKLHLIDVFKLDRLWVFHTDAIVRQDSVVIESIGKWWCVFLLFGPCEYHIDLCNKLCSSIWLAAWPSYMAKTYIGHDRQIFQPFFICFVVVFVISAMFRGTFDFYHFILYFHWPWPWPWLGVILFSWSGWNGIWCWNNSSWISWYYFVVRFSETKEITAVLLIASKKNFSIGLHLDVW